MYFKLRISRTVQAFLIIASAAVISLLSGLSLPESAPVSGEKAVSLPVIMYHSFLKDNTMHNAYCISPQVLEEDLKYIKNNGYTTVTASELYDYVQGGSLDDKIVMLTFDDGLYNNYVYAYPLLKKYRCKGVLSPVAGLTLEYSQSKIKSPTYGYCSFKELYTMQKSGYVEIANHSYDMHKISPRMGASQMKGESGARYREALLSDVTKAQRLLRNKGIKEPICFTYPYGAESGSTFEIIKDMGFVCTLTCNEKLNTITRSENSLWELGRFLRTDKESSGEFFERMTGRS